MTMTEQELRELEGQQAGEDVHNTPPPGTPSAQSAPAPESNEAHAIGTSSNPAPAAGGQSESVHVTKTFATGVAIDLGFFGQKPSFTPEIERTAQQLAYWQTLDRPGAMVDGLNRVGKTFACRYLASSIKSILGGSTIAFLWPLKKTDKNEVAFLQRRIQDIGGRDYNHSKPGELSKRLVSHLLGRAEAENCARILLILDEAQAITESQFSIICDIQETLAVRHTVFTSLFGQPELRTLAENFKQRDVKNLVSRYMKLSHQMRGIAASDFAKVLEHLDMTTGTSVVERHFPHLYAQGWRLEQIAPALKSALEQLRTAHRIEKPVRLPMEDLRGAVNALLYLMTRTVDKDPRRLVKKSVLLACLKQVKFDEYIHIYVED
jgi:hypothetical protein